MLTRRPGLVTVFIRLPQGFLGGLISSPHGQAQRWASSQHAKVGASWPFQRSHLLAPKCFSSPRVYAAQQQDFSAPAKARFLSPAAGRVNYHATRITSEFESTKIRITKSKNKRKKSSPISWNILGKKHHYK